METEQIWDLLSIFKNDCDSNELEELMMIDEESTKDLSGRDGRKCRHCKSIEIILDESIYICRQCGSITDRFIDMTAEWRYYGSEDSKATDPTRCGMPANALMPESSLGSIISNMGKESYDMKMLRKYHMWNSLSYKERSLYNIFDNITVNAINNGIATSIIEEAKMFYKKVAESKIARGENRSGLIASSIYMSCKSNKVPRSTKEIAKIFNLKQKTMTKGCKKFQDIMPLNIDSTSADDFIQRFCSKLGLDNEVRDLCRHIVQKADELCIVSENTPPSISAGSIYLCNVVCGLNISKKDMATACELSQVTLSKCYKKLYEHRGLLFTPDAVYKYNIK
jgi:transcription initiation factor TFIIB